MTFQYHASSPMLANWLIGLCSGAPTFLLGLAAYVLTGLALHTIAKNRGLHKAWLAWVPVANVWLLGSISDQYRYVVKGQRRAKRNWLLVLNILKSSMITGYLGLLVSVLIRMAFGGIGDFEDLMLTALGYGLVGGGISLVYGILYFMVLYDVYTSMDPDSNTLFLILSIFIPVTRPFFLFFLRNKESGMPPRRPVNPVEEAQYL